MKAFQRLAAAYPASIGAGDIARGCKVPQNTMSTHLAILTRAGLLHVERAGRQMNYRADLDGIRAVVMYLAKECSDGRSDLCASLVADLATDRPIEKGGRKASTRSHGAKPAEKPRL
jgi:DNA-binding transcriptional ArsR family regulator